MSAIRRGIFKLPKLFRPTLVQKGFLDSLALTYANSLNAVGMVYFFISGVGPKAVLFNSIINTFQVFIEMFGQYCY
mgnify:CR=1 FL=1